MNKGGMIDIEAAFPPESRYVPPVSYQGMIEKRRKIELPAAAQQDYQYSGLRKIDFYISSASDAIELGASYVEMLLSTKGLYDGSANDYRRLHGI